MEEKRSCPICGEEFLTKRPSKIYCSSICAGRGHYLKEKERRKKAEGICPTCGEKAHIGHFYRQDFGERMVIVICDNCEASGKAFAEISFNPDDDEEKAIKAWNRRVDNG